MMPKHMSSPVSVHAGIFVQSRLPIVLHRVIPGGTLSLHNIGMVEAALIGVMIDQYVLGGRGGMMENAVAGAIGAGLYHMAPP
jgi:hypothetical protein